VSSAVSQLDQATQQNAALVEESAAAADSLNQQAAMLVEAVKVFKLGTAHTADAAHIGGERASRELNAARVAPAKQAAAVQVEPRKPAEASGASADEQSWETF